MAQAALVWAASLALWLALIARSMTPASLALAAMAAALSTGAALRLGLADGLTKLAHTLLRRATWRYLASVAQGFSRTAGPAFSPRVALRPALLRVVADPNEGAAAFAEEVDLLRAAGAVLVDVDTRGVLLHVLDEDSAAPASAP